MFSRPIRRAVWLLAASAALVTLSAASVSAQLTPSRSQHVVFGGAGTQEASSNMPFVVGYQYLSPTSAWIFGADLASEGTQNDNTYGSSTVEAAISFNALVGRGLRIGERWHLGVSGLLGARQTGKDCPTSYLGYQCYADEAPSVSYTVNFGGVAHIAYRRLMVGVRKTAVSTQALLGIAF